MTAKTPGKAKAAAGPGRRRVTPCPKCGSTDVVPIMYGYPMQEAMEAAAHGEIELGGCCVGERDPRKHCKACGEQFDRPPAHTRKRAEDSPKGMPRR